MWLHDTCVLLFQWNCVRKTSRWKQLLRKSMQFAFDHCGAMWYWCRIYRYVPSKHIKQMLSMWYELPTNIMQMMLNKHEWFTFYLKRTLILLEPHECKVLPIFRFNQSWSNAPWKKKHKRNEKYRVLVIDEMINDHTIWFSPQLSQYRSITDNHTHSTKQWIQRGRI